MVLTSFVTVERTDRLARQRHKNRFHIGLYNQRVN